MSRTRRFKRKIRWKNVIILAVALALVIYLISSLIGMVARAVSSSSDTFTACKLSTSSLAKKVSGKEYQGTLEMNDYVFYGEYLSLYSEAYEVGSSAGFVGKTLILKNVCNGKSITIDKTNDLLDGQIDLKSLPAGLYEVYVVDNLLEKRLYAPSVISTADTFFTAARGGSRNAVKIYADASLFNKKNASANVMDKNYVFIDVRKETVPDTVYDIALNPGPVAIDNNASAQGNNLDETSEMYRLAEAVQKKLTADGYRVMITREKYDWSSTYGASGTAAKAYSAAAKYFISLSMYADDTLTGVEAVHSSYVSAKLASDVYKQLTALGLAGQYGDNSVLASDLDGVYDSDFDIRETGGKALGAGKINDRAIADNGYAAEYNGMESLYLELCNVSNSDEAANWNANFDKIAEAIASGIENYLNNKEQ